MSFTKCDAVLHSLAQRSYRQLFAVGAALLLLVAPLARAQGNTPSPNAQCPLEDALNFHVVAALHANGVTEEQFEALVAAGELKGEMPAVCMNEINNAAAHPDTNCQIFNGEAMSRLSSYFAVAGFLFAVTGDAPTCRTNIRAILKNYLENAPHKCWFQAVATPQPNQTSPGGPAQGLTPQQCAQLRANFEACKQQANQALQQCTVTSRWQRNCAMTAPTCMLPPC